MRQAWKIAKALERGESLSIPGTEVELPASELKRMLDVDIPLGDGQAEFFPEATEEEYQEYLRNEEHGWNQLFKRFGKKKHETQA